MNRADAIAEVKRNWKQFYPMSKDRKGIICPLCGHGKSGDGIKENPKGNKYSLICFGCKFSGDIIDLVGQENGLEFNDAFMYAADKLGITVENDFTSNYSQENLTDLKRTAAEKEQIEAVTMPIADYTGYYKTAAENLEQSNEALSYLQARGISTETARKYKLGYDAQWKSPTALFKYEKGLNEKEPYPSARIIIPMTAQHYLARAVDKVNTIPKMNETGGGGIDFFNYDSIKSATEPVFIVEGAFDALSIIEMGGTAIALNSTSNADKFIERLKTAAEPIKTAFIVCLDNDGNESTHKATERLTSGLNALGLKYINGDITGAYKDANEALTGNKEQFKAAVLKAKEQASKLMSKTHLQEFFNKIQTEAYKPYKTGVNFFDNLLDGGVIKQSLLLLLAAPGTGKTTLCQQIAEAMAANKHKVLYLNFEMSREQMLAKSISCRLAYKDKFYTAKEILQGYSWSEKAKADITEAITEYEQTIYPYMRYNPKENVADLDELLQYLKNIGEDAKSKGEEAPVIIIDYLHLITNSRGLDNQELIKQAIVGLKDYAKNYDTFVMAISATGRDTNKGGGVTLNSARDSSNIEYTGDYMLGLNYKAVFDGTVKASKADEVAKLQQANPREMILQVLKARLGRQGSTATLYYDSAHNFFYGENEFAPCSNSAFENKEQQTAKQVKKRY